jgi:hypothetical protein
MSTFVGTGKEYSNETLDHHTILSRVVQPEIAEKFVVINKKTVSSEA